VEIGILVIAQHWQGDYVRQAHIREGKAAGLSQETIDAILAGKDPKLADAHERAVHRFAAALVSGAKLSDAEFAEIEQALGREGIAEVLVLLGYYTSVALAMKVHEVPIPQNGRDAPRRRTRGGRKRTSARVRTMNLNASRALIIRHTVRPWRAIIFTGPQISRPERFEDPRAAGAVRIKMDIKERTSTCLAGSCRTAVPFVMIKPTHYDDDGYPILWYRSAIPSNTLACLNGLAEDAHRRNVLGPDVEIRLHTYDETNRRAQPERIIRRSATRAARR
jgi:hypothetical protein